MDLLVNVAVRHTIMPELVAITAHFLCRTSWEFGPGDHDAVLGVMRFVPGGRIFGYNHPNERRWSLEGGVLLIFSEDGLCTSRFQLIETSGSRLVMHSRLRIGTYTRHFTLRQRKIIANFDQHLEAFHARDRLVDLRRPLLTIFNSGGNPYAGKAVVWEYLQATADPGVDYLRMAERTEPPSWYLKTAEQVKARIRGATLGRRKVVLAGASSGGYAAIRFGEWLAEQGCVEEVVSISVNPQTVHSLPHRQHLWANHWDDVMPPTIEDETLDFLAVKDVDLHHLIGRSRKTPVRHLLFYDSRNPAERYYAACLEACPGVTLHPVPIGLPHALGIQEMERHGVMHSAITTALNDASV